MTASVQGLGLQIAGTPGSDPFASQAVDLRWQEGARARFDSARMDGAIKPNLVGQAAYQSLIAPLANTVEVSARLRDNLSPAEREQIRTSGMVPLTALTPEAAQEVLDARNEAIKEFFESWGESIRKNAAADKKSAFAAMLKQARLRALSQARMFVSGRGPSALNQSSSNRAPDANRAPGVRAAANTLASGGVNPAFTSTAGRGFGLRRS